MFFNATCTCGFEDVGMDLWTIGTDLEILHGMWLMGYIATHSKVKTILVQEGGGGGGGLAD